VPTAVRRITSEGSRLLGTGHGRCHQPEDKDGLFNRLRDLEKGCGGRKG